MARIRTIKPDLARHEGMFQAEEETGLPLRFAWAMLFTACDREGRFRWRPAVLKLDVLPFDDVDFSRVLHAWATRGFVVKYRVGDAWFGCIPTWRRHQTINNREQDSDLPGIDLADEVWSPTEQGDSDACGTRERRVDNDCGTRQVHAQGEGEGKGKGKGSTSSLRSDGEPDGPPLVLEQQGPPEATHPPAEPTRSPPDPDETIWQVGVQMLAPGGRPEGPARALLGKLAKQHGKLALAEAIGRCAALRPVDPRAWLVAALRPQQQRDPAEDGYNQADPDWPVQPVRVKAGG